MLGFGANPSPAAYFLKKNSCSGLCFYKTSQDVRSIAAVAEEAAEEEAAEEEAADEENAFEDEEHEENEDEANHAWWPIYPNEKK